MITPQAWETINDTCCHSLALVEFIVAYLDKQPFAFCPSLLFPFHLTCLCYFLNKMSATTPPPPEELPPPPNTSQNQPPRPRKTHISDAVNAVLAKLLKIKKVAMNRAKNDQNKN